MSKSAKLISLICRAVIALIFLQTVILFKFPGAEESKYIFTVLMGEANEAIGRIGSGIAEVIASILILHPSTVSTGAVMSLGVITGAILSHITQLGIVVQDDGGALFMMAVLIFVLSLVVLFIHRKELPIVGKAL